MPHSLGTPPDSSPSTACASADICPPYLPLVVRQLCTSRKSLYTEANYCHQTTHNTRPKAIPKTGRIRSQTYNCVEPYGFQSNSGSPVRSCRWTISIYFSQHCKPHSQVAAGAGSSFSHLALRTAHPFHTDGQGPL